MDANGRPEVHFGDVNYALAVHVQHDFPQVVEKIVRFNDNSNTLVGYDNGKKSFVESRLFFADPGVFDIFSWRLLKGNTSNALTQINTVVISESVAKRYFDSTNPMGKILIMNREIPLMVTGVFEDIPHNSHFKPDMLVSMLTRDKIENLEDLMRDQSNNDATYILLRPGVDITTLRTQLPVDLDKYYELQPDGRKGSQVYRYYYWPLLRSTLFFQFIAEAFLFAFFSLLLALFATYLTLPFFNTFIGKSLHLGMIVTEPMVTYSVLILLLVVSAVAGGYPAFYLSSFKASEVMKRGVTTSWKRFSVRSLLVGVQFLLAFVLIISVIVVRQQMEFVNSYDIGFDRNSLLVLPSSPDIYRKFKIIKERLEQHPGIEKVSLSSRVPSGRLADSQDAMIEVSGKLQPLDLRIADVHVDHDYFKLLGLPIIAGRDFNYDLSSDSLEAFILNETAVNNIGWKSNEEAIGKIFHYGSVRKGTVVGVVKDFNFESLHEPIKPIVFVITHGRARTVLMRIDETVKVEILKYLEEQWAYWRPGFPFTYYSLSDNFEKQYESEKRVGMGVSFLAAIAVFISSLGVFGLALFMAEQRSREMGIRKVLGAGSWQIMVLFGKWFIILMTAAGLISIPISFALTMNWLNSFSFATEIGYAPYAIAFVIVLSCTLLSILIQIFRSAVQNPVNALRCE